MPDILEQNTTPVVVTAMRTSTLLLSLIAPLNCGTDLLAQDKPLVKRSSPLQVVEPDAEDRALRMTPVVRAVQRAADSVVSIYLQTQDQLARRQPVTEGQGSGVILDDSGLIITNSAGVSAWSRAIPGCPGDGSSFRI